MLFVKKQNKKRTSKVYCKAGIIWYLVMTDKDVVIT